MSKRPTADERRRHLLEAAITTFAEKGFEAATMDDIVVQAKMGKGTAYRYVASKDELYLFTFTQILDELSERIGAAVDHITTLREHMDKAIETYFDFFERQPQRYCVFLHHVGRWQGDLQSRLMEIFFDRLAFKGSETRRFILEKKCRTIPATDIVMGAFGLINMFLYHWHVTGRTTPLQEKRPVVLELLMKGIAP